MSTDAPGDSEASPSGRGRAVGLLAVVAIITFVADLASKLWALQALADGHRIALIDGVLGLRLLRNSGAAFSMGDSRTWLMTLLSVVITVGIVVVGRRVTHRAWAIALGMILGGAIGNLIDRFFRDPGFGQGHVVDFIDYFGWFVGNVADIGIVVGAVWAVLLSVREVPFAPRDQDDEPEAVRG